MKKNFSNSSRSVWLFRYLGAVQRMMLSLYNSDDGNGLYAVYEHMDTQVITKIQLSGSAITEEEIHDGNFPTNNYVQTLMATDYSLLS